MRMFLLYIIIHIIDTIVGFFIFLNTPKLELDFIDSNMSLPILGPLLGSDG